MRRNRRVRNFNEEEESKKLIYISIAVVVLAIVAFVITYIVYSNALKKTNDLGDLTSKITEIAATPEETSEAASPISKTVNEIKETDVKNEEEPEKIAINTTNIVKETQNKNTQENTTQTTTTVKEVEKVADPTFIKPVEGEILREFANENLVYSETLKEWITHNGIDIKADSKTIVKAASEGTIKSIKNDPRYGITVVIEHVNGFVSVYSNLLTAEFVKEGEIVKQGQTIGTIGNTASFEIADESHLHFEILKDNEYLNPSEYIK